MIQTVRLYKDLVDTAKIGTAGYQRADEFNNALDAVQTSLMSLLSPLYASERSVKDLLAPFIVRTNVSGGVIPKPDDYEQLISISISGHPVTQVDPNEDASQSLLPSRRPNAANGVYNVVEHSNSFIVTPTGSGNMSYIRRPLTSHISLSASSTDDSDYVTPSATINLEWPEKAYNLIFYMMLDRFGISQKEALLMEYSKFGIQQEAAKL